MLNCPVPCPMIGASKDEKDTSRRAAVVSSPETQNSGKHWAIKHQSCATLSRVGLWTVNHPSWAAS